MYARSSYVLSCQIRLPLSLVFVIMADVRIIWGCRSILSNIHKAEFIDVEGELFVIKRCFAVRLCKNDWLFWGNEIIFSGLYTAAYFIISMCIDLRVWINITRFEKPSFINVITSQNSSRRHAILLIIRKLEEKIPISDLFYTNICNACIAIQAACSTMLSFIQGVL